VKYEVIVLPRAMQDIEETWHFIAVVQQQPLVAQRWLDGIQQRISGLASLPKRGRRIREQEFLDTTEEVREVLFGNHRVLYTVNGELVQIVHVRRGLRGDVGPEML
jgi:plasmid stabilization system protein ParE